MIPTLVFDLETVPDAAGLRRLYAGNNDLSHLSDLELVTHVQAQRQAAGSSDFLPCHLQQVAVISCAFRDKQGWRIRSLGNIDDPEPVLLASFFKTIECYTPRLVSWNGSGFDLPVLHYRSLIHGIPAPRYWDMGEDDRTFKYNNYIGRYHMRHIDLMDVLAKYNRSAYAPLDQLAKLCGFPGKLGMDGSQVWQAWSQGKFAEVRAYCETDVINTWLVYCRWRLLCGELDQAAYQTELDLVRQTLTASGAAHYQEYLAAWQ